MRKKKLEEKQLYHGTDSSNDSNSGILKSIIITIVIVVLYRLGSCLPVPGVPYQSIESLIGSGTGFSATMSLLNLFAGGSLKYISLFSLSIMPYITATIVMQILTYVVPSLHQLQEEGQAGSIKINQYARYMTLGLSVLNAIGYFFMFKSIGVTFTGSTAPEWMLILMFIGSLVGGSMLLMYMGEKISDTNLFQGASVLILVNVLSSVPTSLYETITSSSNGTQIAIITLIFVLLLVPFLVLMEMGQRRIPLIYGRQKSVDSEFAEKTTYLPIKAMSQGVVPVIFASVVVYLPLQLSVFFPDNTVLQNIASSLSTGPISWSVQAILIILISWGYSIVAMKPDDIADNLAKQAAFISNPRLNPGTETAEYIQSVLLRVVMPASIILAAIAIVPNIVFAQTSNQLLQTFSGTSLLIIIGTVVQCIMAVDSQKTMTAYEGGKFNRRKRRAVFGEAEATK